MDEQQPTSFGRYKVKGVIGKGAMGVIYLAEDPVIGRQLAIKVIQLNPGISAQEIENLQTRFEREFRSAGTLSHPNIVTVHDVGKEGATPYIAMEYVEGKTLEHVISEQRVLSFEEVADMVGQICDGLDFAHQHGVVHRDVKPANILLDRNGPPQDHRLRCRQAHRVGHDPHRDHGRHALVHVARAGGGRDRHRRRRPVLGRGDDLPAPHPRAAVHR